MNANTIEIIQFDAEYKTVVSSSSVYRVVGEVDEDVVTLAAGTVHATDLIIATLCRLICTKYVLRMSWVGQS